MKKMTRILSLLLCLVMVVGALASCKKQEEEGETSATVATVPDGETQWETDENGYVKDTITDDMKYNGELVRILGWENAKNRTLPEDSGDGKDTVLSAVYAQRLNVAARLDVKFDVTYINADGNVAQTRDDFLFEFSTGEDKYDLIQTQSLFPMLAAQQGYLLNLKDQVYPQLEMPWWPDSVSLWEQYGKLYFVANNSSVKVIDSTTIMFSNTGMITSKGVTDPVELAVDGKWTIDTMLQYAKMFSGEAASDTTGKTFGLLLYDYTKTDALYYAAFNSTVNDNNGVAKIAVSDSSYRQRVNDYCKKITEAFSNTEFGIAPANNQYRDNIFNDMTAAFFIADMEKVSQFRDNSTYAVVPLPKLSDDGEYRTIQSNGYDVWCIPKTNSDGAALAGVVIEAFASSEYRNIAPFYYEKYLRDRYSTSALGAKAFDVIRDSIFSDLGRVAQFTLVNDKGGLISPEALWRLCLGNKEGKNPQDRYETVYTEWGAVCANRLLELQAALRDNNR